jgi:hypothetical protein
MLYQLDGRQQSVRSCGVAMEIDVEHEAIVREARYAS